MRAYRVSGHGHAELVELPRPEPQNGDALIKVAGAGMCGSDVHAVDDPIRYGYPLPMTLGHEVTGWVYETVGTAARVEPGTAVAVYSMISCHRCLACAEGRANLCRRRFPQAIGASQDGGMADYVIGPLENLVELGDLDPVASAPLTDAGMTSMNAVQLARPSLTPGSRCVLIGIGGLGHLALQIVYAMTPALVIAVDIAEDRLASAARLGAWHCVRAGSDAAGQITELCGGIGADVVIDLVASPSSVKLACRVVGAGGSVIMVGLDGGVVPVALGRELPPGVTAVTPVSGSIRNLRDVLTLAREGRDRDKHQRVPVGAGERSS